MNLIKNFRPNGLEVTLDDERVVKVMMIRENPRKGIVARVKGEGRIILWNSDDAAAHREDTDEQFVTQIKAVI